MRSVFKVLVHAPIADEMPDFPCVATFIRNGWVMGA